MPLKVISIVLLWLLIQKSNCATEGQECDLYQSFNSCDNQNTKLECRQGRCYCPTRTTYRNLPLNTVWYRPLNKCVSMFRSACDRVYSIKGYECEPGLNCNYAVERQDDNIGICKGSIGKPNLLHSSITVVVSLMYLFWQK